MDGRAPIAEHRRRRREAAEEGGASTLWIACHLFLRDPVTTAALALARDQEDQDRADGDEPLFDASGLHRHGGGEPRREVSRPGDPLPRRGRAGRSQGGRHRVAASRWSTIGEAVKVCRQLFAGEMADFQGRMFNVAGRRLANGGRDIPIVIAASRPNMLKLAGRRERRRADLGRDLAAVREGLPRPGRRRPGSRSASRHRLHQARLRLDPIRRPIGFVLRGAHHAENIRLGGASLDQQALAAAYAAENWSEVDRLVSDDVVRRHTPAARRQQVRDKLDEYRAIGLDEVVLGGMDDAASIAATLAGDQG